MGAAASSSSVVSGSTTSTLVHNESSGRSSGASSTPTSPIEECEPMLPKNNGTPLPAATGNLSPAQRRSFRNLFRSISANSDHGKCRQFLKGDPRGPSDVAPPSPHTPHRSHSHSENDRRRPKRNRRVLKSTSELLSNDMVFCGKDVTDHHHHHHFDQDENDEDDDDEDHEVFLGIDDARYYNLSATLPHPRSTSLGQRRHSIGTFLGKDRNPSANTTVLSGIKVTQGTSLVEPDVPAPPVPVEVHREEKKQRSGNKSKRKGHKDSSSKGGSRSATVLSKVEAHAEDDVVFVSSKESEASSLWVSYLTACFEQISRQQGRPPFKVRHVTVEESIPPGIEEKVKSARLQIIVVCPVLLERVIGRPENATSLSRHLIVDRVLAMMLGVQEDHVTESHRAALVTYNQWRKFFVKDQDETFVGEFLGAAVAILGTTPPSALRNDKTAFTVHPKKVKLGHNKVIVLLNDPLRPEDNVTVIVDRCGEGINITHVKRRNPYTLQFSIPERCLEMSMLVGVRVFKNDCPLGVKQVKCESRLRELDQILRAHDNPLEFMCQTFGFNPGDREQLDNWMVHAFQKNVPPHFSLLSTPSGLVPAHRNHISPEENPTLLHFAARFGLERLAWQLLDCPGGDLACDLKNIAEMTPADLAEQAGHHRLAHQLRGYMQMNEFTNMYSYLKGISETAATPTSHTSSNEHHSSTTNHHHQPQQGSDNANNDQEDYCRPRPLSEAYSVPPAARPITTLISPCQLSSSATNSSINTAIDMNYSIVPTPTPVITTTTNGIDVPQGYMKMHPVGPKLASSSSNVFVQQPLNNYRTTTPTPQLSRQNSHFDDNIPPSTSSTISLSSTRTISSSNSKSSTTTGGDSSAPRDELLEIINDFKNNVFTISEVEKLVENWRNRNDVQQSFKDKQRQLTAMREEYERIQKKMKEEMKAPTPFDRIKKFFSKGKKDTKDPNTTNTNDDSSSSNTAKSDTVNGGLSDRRPVSSLSLHSVSSSSSSGRMSTVSRCSGTSLGDSGTHSDPEDRRLQNREENKSGVMSYEIPPAPKPFTGSYSPTLRYTPSPRSSSTSNDLELRSTHTLIRTGNTEYYIAYPPSGLPIHTFKPDGTMREPKTPCTPIESPHNNFPESFVQLGSTKENNINNNVNTNTKSNTDTEGYANVNIPSSSSSTNLENTETTSGSNSNNNNSVNQNNTSKDVKEIPCNEANRQDDGGNYVNVDPTVPMPVPPLPLLPPPGMCIPTDYMNVAPMIKEPSPASNEQQHIALSINSENIEESRSRSPSEYVRAHVTHQDCQGVDVVDSFNPMHEYMNLGGQQQQEQVRIVGSLPKKSPAPPVPPRIVTKK